MANTDAYALPRSDLNGFLFADIGVDDSGMNLSVISALARLGIDPWLEAGRLAKLPRAVAIEGLARLIAAMPASLWPIADATPIATRLVALLPTRDSVSSAASVGDAKTGFRLSNEWLIIAALTVAVVTALAVRLTTAPDAPQPAPTSLATPAPPAPPRAD